MAIIKITNVKQQHRILRTVVISLLMFVFASSNMANTLPLSVPISNKPIKPCTQNQVTQFNLYEISAFASNTPEYSTHRIAMLDNNLPTETLSLIKLLKAGDLNTVLPTTNQYYLYNQEIEQFVFSMDNYFRALGLINVFWVYKVDGVEDNHNQTSPKNMLKITLNNDSIKDKSVQLYAKTKAAGDWIETTKSCQEFSGQQNVIWLPLDSSWQSIEVLINKSSISSKDRSYVLGLKAPDFVANITQYQF